jgi:hypothetical protein
VGRSHNRDPERGKSGWFRSYPRRAIEPRRDFLRNPWAWANGLAVGISIFIGNEFRGPHRWWPGLVALLISVTLLSDGVQVLRARSAKRRNL